LILDAQAFPGAQWPDEAEEPVHYWLSNLPKRLTWETMADTVMGRWRIERDYEELKQELGLGHYEGRNWRGFHHHASLCIAAYGFLMLERLAGSKKNAAQFEAPPLPEAFRPRGAGPDAAP
jgi:SRSO17 transposase